jgi:phosphatidylglycerophosphate synthase
MIAVVAAIGASQMVSYTRARAEGLGIQLSGGMMQRAERIVLVSGGALLAAWYAADPDSASAATPILGGTMVLCAVTSAATALSRWLSAYRKLAERETAEAQPVTEPAQMPVRLPAAAMTTSDLHKIRPLEQH